MKEIDEVISYINKNAENIDNLYKDFFNKKYTKETLVFSFPPLSKNIKDIDIIKEEPASKQLSWQCVFLKNIDSKINFLPKTFLPEISDFLIEVNVNTLAPNTKLPEHSDHFDRTIIHMLLNDLDNDSYITLEGTPLILRKKYDIVHFNYNKTHGAANNSSNYRKTFALLFDRVLV